ncbi:MAG TPA: hypothetical protein VF503_08600 [Sphingobium sp.]|uniref:hypothetical protein n=1 Tax=Sphingobium sp. TaxID=1912891 RepID=UPI002ED16BF7
MTDNLFSSNWQAADEMQHQQINPATGLPMIGGYDAAGNPFGADLDDWHHRHQPEQHWHHDTHFIDTHWNR